MTEKEGIASIMGIGLGMVGGAGLAVQINPIFLIAAGSVIAFLAAAYDYSNQHEED